MESKKEKLLILLVLAGIFFFVYSIHFVNEFPNYLDEWFHMSKAISLLNLEYVVDWRSLEIGFHIFLAFLGIFTNLPKIYQFLPAIWAAVSALTLYYIARKKNDYLNDSFLIAIFAMIFFGSIKSNVNISGLWFFTPLSFSIPFIFLYIYFFTEGIEKQNKKMIFYSFIIIILLLFTHALSFLFAFPFLFVYSILNYKFVLKNWKFFSSFILIALIGIIFFFLVMNISIKELVPILLKAMTFKYGWGVNERNNSPLELYSLIGYVFAFFGILSIILMSKEERKKYIAYILLPFFVLISILIFKLTRVSYISPYQRNLYYLVISLPFLSALGLSFLKSKLDIFLNKNVSINFKKILYSVLLILIIFFCFNNYFNIPEGTTLYKLIETHDYDSINFLKNLPKHSVIMSDAELSMAIYPVSGQTVITMRYFPDAVKTKDVNDFFSDSSCDYKNNILKKYNATYVLSRNEINCNWKILYNKTNYVYEA